MKYIKDDGKSKFLNAARDAKTKKEAEVALLKKIEAEKEKVEKEKAEAEAKAASSRRSWGF